MLELFKFDLNKIVESTTGGDPREKVYTDAWDSAKATGNLSTLKSDELGVLSDIYLQVRRVNEIIDDPHTIGITASFNVQKAEVAKRDLLTKIETARNKFAWLRQQPKVPKEEISRG